MAQWIRPWALTLRILVQIWFAASVIAPFNNALHPYCLVPQRGLKAIGHMVAYKQHALLE